MIISKIRFFKKKSFLKTICYLTLIGLFTNCSKNEKAKPNIIIILADDFGVGDIKAHFPDNKIPTPNLDRLVASGMSFTDAHSPSSVCTPTRYGLLTGRYSWRTRLQKHVLGCYEPPLIKAEELTLPGYLKRQGYNTSCIGKWHLGWNWPGSTESQMIEPRNVLMSEEWDFSKPIKEGPTTRGFDYFYGVAVPNYPPYCFIENDHTIGIPTSQKTVTNLDGLAGPMLAGWKMDEILPEITRKASSYISEYAKKEEPFFLYFSMTSPHEPVAPSKSFKGKSGIAPIADFIMETDWSVGQIMNAIEKTGITENTILIFTADNGHSKYTGWDKLIDAGHKPSGDFKGAKGDIWEGGHRVPFIIQWPGQVASGTENNQILSLTDILATVADLFDEKLPDDAGQDSQSFMPTMLNDNSTVLRNDLISHSVAGEFSIRQGPWKLVFALTDSIKSSQASKTVEAVQLFNLSNDKAETTDISGSHPDVVTRLRVLAG